jgi:hypothetical protein
VPDLVPDLPPGFTAADVSLAGFNDLYQSAAQVAGSVGCAWMHAWGLCVGLLVGRRRAAGAPYREGQNRVGERLTTSIRS